MRCDAKSVGPNLIRNGDFKNGTADWTGVRLEVKEYNHKPGLWCGRNSTVLARQQTGVEVTPDKLYQFTFYVAAEGDPIEFTLTDFSAYITGEEGNIAQGIYTYEHDRLWTINQGVVRPMYTGVMEAVLSVVNRSPFTEIYVTELEIAEVIS